MARLHKADPYNAIETLQIVRIGVQVGRGKLTEKQADRRVEKIRERAEKREAAAEKREARK